MIKHGYKYITISVDGSTKSVAEHRFVAEKMLGRKLKAEEVVHHKDGDKTNNDECNLMVFATNSDHLCFHASKKVEVTQDGVYYCPEYVPTKNIGKYQSRKRICPICKTNKMENHAKMCLSCYAQKSKSYVHNTEIRKPNKDELLTLILNFSFLKIGAMFGVSDNAVRKWCKNYDLPYKYHDIKALKLERA